ncbi:hypothetical protein HYE59_06315 [Aggregatibacter actinomycetemcomitans]|uniref:hypothetical protein n=1 Tax=Aggregatibacter actinomycetemcomitans TaxID=714 RepID=UPI00197B1B8C|nr:hypothetical protein [Aggregatibacter actinomycetemcomitans]MBN6077151.1 hypothetical protein [Aggregatibacter actinomycetemcomitans]
MNGIIEKLEDIDGKLYGKNDMNGEWIYYLDKICERPFNGIVYGMCKSTLDYEAEIKDGYKNGIEVNYRADGSIEQISEYKHNLLYGISKEFDENNLLVTVSVVLNNSHLKIVEVNLVSGDFNIVKYQPELHRNIPEDILKLLDLSTEELISYKFKSKYNLLEDKNYEYK